MMQIKEAAARRQSAEASDVELRAKTDAIKYAWTRLDMTDEELSFLKVFYEMSADSADSFRQQMAEASNGDWYLFNRSNEVMLQRRQSIQQVCIGDWDRAAATLCYIFERRASLSVLASAQRARPCSTVTRAESTCVRVASQK